MICYSKTRTMRSKSKKKTKALFTSLSKQNYSIRSHIVRKCLLENMQQLDVHRFSAAFCLPLQMTQLPFIAIF